MTSIELVNLVKLIKYLWYDRKFFSFIRAPDETEVQCEFVTEVGESRASLEVGYWTSLASHENWTKNLVLTIHNNTS